MFINKGTEAQRHKGTKFKKRNVGANGVCPSSDSTTCQVAIIFILRGVRIRVWGFITKMDHRLHRFKTDFTDGNYQLLYWYIYNGENLITTKGTKFTKKNIYTEKIRWTPPERWSPSLQYFHPSWCFERGCVFIPKMDHRLHRFKTDFTDKKL